MYAFILRLIGMTVQKQGEGTQKKKNNSTHFLLSRLTKVTLQKMKK